MRLLRASCERAHKLKIAQQRIIKLIYDCFIFYNELLMLDFRLNQLSDYVDKFVIVEANRTFTGKPKKLFFKENIDQFSDFADRIEHIVVSDLPKHLQNPWILETHQRNAMLRGLNSASENDIIFMSDVDEIPDIEHILSHDLQGNIYRLNQLFFYYFFNLNVGHFDRSFVSLHKNLRLTPQEARTIHFLPVIEKAGWHFSYLMSAEGIRNKIRSFSHQELNTETFTDIAHIERAIQSQTDLFNRNARMNVMELNDKFPKYLVQNTEKYQEFIL